VALRLSHRRATYQKPHGKHLWPDEQYKLLQKYIKVFALQALLLLKILNSIKIKGYPQRTAF